MEKKLDRFEPVSEMLTTGHTLLGSFQNITNPYHAVPTLRVYRLRFSKLYRTSYSSVLTKSDLTYLT
jgi:hypothetical protein